MNAISQHDDGQPNKKNPIIRSRKKNPQKAKQQVQSKFTATFIEKEVPDKVMRTETKQKNRTESSILFPIKINDQNAFVSPGGGRFYLARREIHYSENKIC